MRKLSSTEPTVTFRLRMPRSMRLFLEQRKGGASGYVRKLIAEKMKRSK